MEPSWASRAFWWRPNSLKSPLYQGPGGDCKLLASVTASECGGRARNAVEPPLVHALSNRGQPEQREHNIEIPIGDFSSARLHAIAGHILFLGGNPIAGIIQMGDITPLRICNMVGQTIIGHVRQWC